MVYHYKPGKGECLLWGMKGGVNYVDVFSLERLAI